MKSDKFVFFLLSASGFWLALFGNFTSAQISNFQQNEQPRTLADLIRSMDQATIKTGFVLHLFTNEEVQRIEKATIEHNKRHQEFAEKSNLLEKRANDLNRNNPSNFSRVISTSERMFVRYDKDKDGILSEQEVAAIRTNTDGIDTDGDNRIEKKEFLRWMFSKLNRPRKVRAGGHPVPKRADLFALPLPAIPATAKQPERSLSEKEIDELLAEKNAIAELQRKLHNEYGESMDYRSPQAYYKIMEATNEFIRLQNETEERIIPIAAIKEFRRLVPKKPTETN